MAILHVSDQTTPAGCSSETKTFNSLLTDPEHTFPSCPPLQNSIPGSFAGLGFLSWYLAGKMKAFDRRGHVAKLCVVVLPLLLAAMVAVSRVDDYWHHWQDVFAGGILGRHSPLFQVSAGSPTVRVVHLLPTAEYSSLLF